MGGEEELRELNLARVTAFCRLNKIKLKALLFESICSGDENGYVTGAWQRKLACRKESFDRAKNAGCKMLTI